MRQTHASAQSGLQRNRHQLSVAIGLSLLSLLAEISATHAQSLEDTITFLSEFTAKQGLMRASSCKAEEVGHFPTITDMYATIPTGTNLGLVELNHGTPNGRTGHTQFDLHDIDKIEIGAAERIDATRTYQSVRITCKGDGACIEKLTYCGGEVRERRAQVKQDALYFRGASSAERAAKALSHLQGLMTEKGKSSPF